MSALFWAVTQTSYVRQMNFERVTQVMGHNVHLAVAVWRALKHVASAHVLADLVELLEIAKRGATVGHNLCKSVRTPIMSV